MSRKSIFVSTITLCVPGIIYNIEKARQIDCMYVDCAQRWTSAGLNPYTCEAMRANAYCNFVYGQIWHIIPFTGILEAMGKMIEIFTSSPWAAIGMVYGAACAIFDKGSAKMACRLPQQVMTWYNFFSGIIADATDLFAGDETTDYCGMVLGDEG